MTRIVQQTEKPKIASALQAVAFAVALCLLAFHQLGGAAPALSVLCAPPASGPAAWSPSGDSSADSAWTDATNDFTSEALLTERRTRLLTGGEPPRFRPAGDACSRFHGRFRPPAVRAKAVFCDVSSLRNVLYPHFSLIAHSSSVLC